VKALPDKQCASDPLPTWLLKKCVGVISLFLCQLFNWSLEHCSVHRVSNAPTLHRCWRKQILIRPTLSPTGRSRTCPSFPSCLSDSLAHSLWNTWRTTTSFQIFSRRIEQCTRRRQLFSRYWLIYCWPWIRVIWRCWHNLTCLPRSTASTTTRYWSSCKSLTVSAGRCWTGSLHICVAVFNMYAHRWPVLHRQRCCTEYRRDRSSGRS